MDARSISKPALSAPFDAAFDGALDFIFGLPETVLGVILAGSVGRGTPDLNSDLDLYVLVAEPHRRRLSRWFAGVPTEIFLNPASRIRRYFEEETANGTASAIEMVATGHLVYDTGAQYAELASEARRVLEAGPMIPADVLARSRYAPADTIENAVDLIDRDRPMAKVLAHVAVFDAMRTRFLVEGAWIPRSKDLLSSIRLIDPAAGALVDDFTTTHSIETARLAVEILTGHSGFHEWETTPD